MKKKKKISVERVRSKANSFFF